MPEIPTTERRRSAGDNHIIGLVVKFVGWPVAGLTLALGISLVATVAYMAINDKESPMFTPLITSVAGALGAGMGYLGGLLSNPRSAPATPGEIGRSIVDEAQKANGLAVDVQSVDGVASDPDAEITRLNGVIADLQSQIGELPTNIEARLPPTTENSDATSPAN